MKNGGDVLEEALGIFKQRNAMYGGHKMRVGKIMAALFDSGVTLKTAEDHERFQHLELAIVKLSRYVNNWEKGGHEDSSVDASVYLAMLHAIDSNIKSVEARSAK